MDVQDLRNWVYKHEVRDRSLEAFWLNLTAFKIEEPEKFEELFWDYDEKHLKVLIEDISLHIKSLDYIEVGNKEREYIEVKVRIEYRSNYVGYYRIHFDVDGKIEDDFFITEWAGLRLYQTRGFLEDIKGEINDNLIKGKITEKEAMKLKAIIEEKKEQIRKEFSNSE